VFGSWLAKQAGDIVPPLPEKRHGLSADEHGALILVDPIDSPLRFGLGQAFALLSEVQGLQLRSRVGAQAAASAITQRCIIEQGQRREVLLPVRGQRLRSRHGGGQQFQRLGFDTALGLIRSLFQVAEEQRRNFER
jgi:hypothetical protein